MKRFFLKLSIAIAVLFNAVTVYAQSSAVAPADNTSTVKVEEPLKVVTPSKLKFSILSSSFFSMEGTNKGSGEGSAITQLRANYKLSDTESLRVNQYLSNDWGGEKSNLKTGDMYLQYARTKLATLPSDVVLNSHARAFLPLSKATQNKGQALSARVGAELSKKLSDDVSLSLNLIPYVNFQSQDSYEVTDAKGKVSRKANNSGSFWYYLSGEWTISKKLSLVQDFGLMRYWYKADSANKISAKTSEYLYADTGLTYAINETFEITGGLSSYLARDLRSQKSDFAVYRDDETDYYLTGTVKF